MISNHSRTLVMQVEHFLEDQQMKASDGHQLWLVLGVLAASFLAGGTHQADAESGLGSGRALGSPTDGVTLKANISADESDNSLNRDADPVVITGEKLISLNRVPVKRIVGFRFRDGWEQIPIQVDERKYVDFGVVYHGSPCGYGTMAYTDRNTYIGPDTDPDFDSDDELVFMAKDADDCAPLSAGSPSGVLEGTRVEVGIHDPLHDRTVYVYLFKSDGSLTPDAGKDYVTYHFNLMAGPYIPNYSTASGPNLEDSEVYSAYYRTHFSDRYIRDELNIYAGGATGVDILDRHKQMRRLGECYPSEDTFSSGEGAFFTNKDGPVRAIRSYMGCNSGPWAQREHLFYEQRQDTTWYIRVHSIGSLLSLYDYSPEAAGMYYYNDLNQNGVLVDGQPDNVTTGPINWEMLTGMQGTVIISHSIETDDPPFPYTSYYSDDITPGYTQCTGDAYEYATSGIWRTSSLPNTDPSLGSYQKLSFHRIVYYEAPGQAVDTAIRRHQQATTFFEVIVTPPPDFNGDGGVDFKDFCKLAQHWFGDEPPVDLAPPPYGDHVVDFRDLAVLSDHWLQEILPLELIAYWKLDETEGFIAHDSAADHNAFVLTDNPLWRPSEGKVAGALELDGIDDLVSAPFVLDPAASAFSVFAWIKGGMPGHVIISQVGAANWLSADPSEGKLMTNLEAPAGRFAPQPLVSESVIADGDWHCIGFTWDGTNRTLYVDGVEAARDTQTGLESADGGLYFGAGKDRAVGSLWCGLLDDVRIYDEMVEP